ncbi:MAG: hypothetical protein RBU37_24335 [Myxococcota bacterium]|jgi:hypothetical protein|nr:hypothetical protein [Myxococcota bacterium]
MKIANLLAALLATALLFVCAAELQAKTVKHPTGNIEFEIPDDWESQLEEDALVLATKDEGVFVLFWAVAPEAVEDGVTALLEKLNEVATDVAVNGEAQETEVNGIPTLAVVGTGKIEGTPIIWTGAILVGSEAKPVILAAVADGSKWSTYESQLVGVISSIRRPGSSEKSMPKLPKIGK